MLLANLLGVGRKAKNDDSSSDQLLSITPYVRYFFNNNENGFTVGMGYTKFDIEAANFDDNGSRNFKRFGPYAEFSYLWLGKYFFNELGYSRWFVDDVNNMDGTSISISGAPGPFYRLGLRF